MDNELAFVFYTLTNPTFTLYIIDTHQLLQLMKRSWTHSIELMTISNLHFTLPAVEEVLDPETDSLVPERTYGCLPADEQVHMIMINDH